MNAVGQRFQCSTDTVIIEGLVDPNRVIEHREGQLRLMGMTKAIIRELIFKHKNPSGMQIFMSVTEKWQSSHYKATYIKLYKKSVSDFT